MASKDASAYGITTVAVLFGLWLLAQSVSFTQFGAAFGWDSVWSRLFGYGWESVKTSCDSTPSNYPDSSTCSANVITSLFLTFGGLASIAGGVAVLAGGDEIHGARGAAVGFGTFLMALATINFDIAALSNVCDTSFDSWSDPLSQADSGQCVMFVLSGIWTLFGALACWAGALATLAMAMMGQKEKKAATGELGIITAAIVIGVSLYLLTMATVLFYKAATLCSNNTLTAAQCGGPVSQGLLVLIGAMFGPLAAAFGLYKQQSAGAPADTAEREKLANDAEAAQGAPEAQSLLV